MAKNNHVNGNSKIATDVITKAYFLRRPVAIQAVKLDFPKQSSNPSIRDKRTKANVLGGTVVNQIFRIVSVSNISGSAKKSIAKNENFAPRQTNRNIASISLLA